MKAKTNGIELNYEIHGDKGPWVVLSHSLACHLHMWDAQIDLLKDRFRVLAFDTRGHGQSDAPSGAYTLDQLVEDARGLLSGVGVEKPHWVGLSMGGMIGMEYALKYQEHLKGLIISNMMASAPAYDTYADEVLANDVDPPLLGDGVDHRQAELVGLGGLGLLHRRELDGFLLGELRGHHVERRRVAVAQHLEMHMRAGRAPRRSSTF